MNRHLLAAALLNALLCIGPLAIARADDPAFSDVSAEVDLGSGGLCSLAAVSDPAITGDVRVGSLQAGPIVFPDPDVVSVTCTVQVGWDSWHTSSDAVSATGPYGQSVHYLPPTQVLYLRTDPPDVWVCTQVDTWWGAAYYFDAASRTWTTSPYVPCAPASGPGVTPPVDTLTCEVVVVEACAGYTAGAEYTSYDAHVPSGVSSNLAGWIDMYDVPLPNGGIVTIPCVVLQAGAQTTDPCALAGGVSVRRVLDLVNEQAVDPAGGSATLATVRVCTATFVLTVDGLGVNSFPGYAAC